MLNVRRTDLPTVRGLLPALQRPVVLKLRDSGQPPIHIVVENGRVTLKGVVTSEVERRVAENTARGAFGVLGVENRLKLERELRSSHQARLVGSSS